MARRKWLILGLTIYSVVVLAQMAPEIAAVNKKVVGKWWTADRKSYIEFLPNGSCSEAGSYTGTWNVLQGKLELIRPGQYFRCVMGNLQLIGPNTLIDYGMGDPVKYYRGLQSAKSVPQLTLVLAQQLLARNINNMTVDNTLLTCHACYDPDDKKDNDKAPIVSTYPGRLIPFLMEKGFIQNVGDRQVFTAKAKQNQYYGFGGLRIANFKNPKILGTKIADASHVPIEYDFVPTPLTLDVFGRVQRIKSFASFSYENEAWRVCIACRN